MKAGQASLFDQGNRHRHTAAFSKAYSNLNAEQQKAVDQIEGPVLVFAGPGTGKTQILAMRIGKILLESDTHAHNILCLTFTEAATVAMRNRLLSIIGPAAHTIHIHTFHSFCNQIIQENLGYFGNYRQLDLISELEKAEVVSKILEGLPDGHLLKRFKGNLKYETRRLNNLVDLMKKENYSAEELHQKVDLFLAQKKDSEDFIAKRKVSLKSGKTYLKGDFRDDKWEQEVRKYEELKAASLLFDKYKEQLDLIQRYDYHDMILWVLKAFEENELLLSLYQERYLYFLVDEFQDTNRSQSQVLEKLIEYWDQPNVFVVGDDDQAIYKFQGANIENIKQFRNKYHPFEVVLTQNYRSGQKILHYSKKLIDNNSSSINKDLTASGPNKDIKTLPQVLYFHNSTQEQAALAQIFEEEFHRGRNLEEMAVIYRNHAQADTLSTVLEKKGIPLNIKKRLNILDNALIQNIIKLLSYLQAEFQLAFSAEMLLFEIMHFQFFQIKAIDIARLSLHINSLRKKGENIKWREFIGNKSELEALNFESINKILLLSATLEKWISDISNVTIQQLFENIINEGNILKLTFHSDQKSWLLQILHTFFDLIKDETKKKPSVHLDELLYLLEKMKENEISLPVNKILQSDKGIHFITAHGAKGLEFEKVFVIGCTADIWDKNKQTRNVYKYPANINEDSQSNEEDERRLFYVAMTRAKKALCMTYATHNDNNKPKTQSRFIDEIVDQIDLIPALKVPENQVVSDFQFYHLLNQTKKIQLIDHDLINNRLKDFKLSVTALNKFIKCPLSFYFEVILEVPKARNQFMGFGRAVHRALQLYFQNLEEKSSIGDDHLIRFFEQAMLENRSHFTDKEFEQLSSYGKIFLPQYYTHALVNIDPKVNFKLECTIQHAHFNDIPLKGILDKVEIHPGYVSVVDYKTGSFINSKSRLSLPTAKNPHGGEYWRQIVFYKLLLNSDKKYNWSMRYGTIDFVEPDRKTQEFNQRTFEVLPEHTEILGDIIEENWQQIQNHKFDQFCDDESCYWCSFVRNDYVFNQETFPDENDLDR